MISEFKFYRVHKLFWRCNNFFQNIGRQLLFFLHFSCVFSTNENTLTCDMLFINRIKEKFAVRISQNPKMSKLWPKGGFCLARHICMIYSSDYDWKCLPWPWMEVSTLTQQVDIKRPYISYISYKIPIF